MRTDQQELQEGDFFNIFAFMMLPMYQNNEWPKGEESVSITFFGLTDLFLWMVGVTVLLLLAVFLLRRGK